MDNTFVLEGENFKLSLTFQVFESDIAYPTNTIISVFVLSAGFSASTSMDVDIKEISEFCNELNKLYSTLKGSTKILEPFGNKQSICFSGDGLGHIHISGTLHSNGADGLWQELKFENSIDQTYFPKFITQLTAYVKQFC